MSIWTKSIMNIFLLFFENRLRPLPILWDKSISLGIMARALHWNLVILIFGEFLCHLILETLRIFLNSRCYLWKSLILLNFFDARCRTRIVIWCFVLACHRKSKFSSCWGIKLQNIWFVDDDQKWKLSFCWSVIAVWNFHGDLNWDEH
jgi:hypothetical protein